ncbi:MAG: response regulator transcription factor [Bacteroidota bacterium]
MNEIAVLIADADYLTREGLKSVLSQAENVVIKAEASTEVELMRHLKQQSFQVAILDYYQSSSFDLSTINTIKKLSPSTGIIIISADDNKARIGQLIGSGINNFLTKRCNREEIITAVRACANRETYFCNTILNHIVEKSFRPKSTQTEKPPSVLTPREQEILHLIAQGFISKQIADQLHIAVHTVYTHRKRILRKLQLKSAAELVVYAVNQGFAD